MPNIIYAIIFFVVLAGIYCLGYYFNHKTPKPKGCEHLDSACEGCKVTSCMKNPVHEFKEGENKDA